MTFVAHDLALALVPMLQPTKHLIRQHDAELAKQLQRAATSALLNLAEGAGRTGADRMRFWRQAYGSVQELKAGLAAAVACGWVDEHAPVRAHAHRLGGVVYGLLR